MCIRKCRFYIFCNSLTLQIGMYLFFEIFLKLICETPYAVLIHCFIFLF